MMMEHHLPTRLTTKLAGATTGLAISIIAIAGLEVACMVQTVSLARFIP